MPIKRRSNVVFTLIEDHPVIIGLAIRLLLTFALPALLDDGLLLQGVRYTDIDYDVFTDAADHVAHGRSPYERHTYRYTPFLAMLLALPLRYKDAGSGRLWGVLFSSRYFGKVLFCIADVLCGYIIVILRRRNRKLSDGNQSTTGDKKSGWKSYLLDLSPELKDALWWLYNPLPINICTRGSAESLVVLLPVLATVAVADMCRIEQSSTKGQRGTLPRTARACFAGILHGIGIHAKLYPVIYTISFMANFSCQHQQTAIHTRKSTTTQQNPNDFGWRYLLSEQMKEIEGRTPSRSERKLTFPWRHPMRILVLGIFWVQRLFFTMSSM